MDSAPFVCAVTLQRPWPYAIAELGANVVNRRRTFPFGSGSLLAIHAGKAWDEAAARWMERYGFEVPPEPEHATGIICVAKFAGNTVCSNSPWFRGPLGWELQNVANLDSAIDCPGAPGVWIPALNLHLVSAIHRFLGSPDAV